MPVRVAAPELVALCVFVVDLRRLGSLRDAENVRTGLARGGEPPFPRVGDRTTPGAGF